MTITEAYNNFYQFLYGTDRCYLPPAELHDWLSQITVTSQQQLESLFVLYNAALCRNPFKDAIKVAKAPRGNRGRAGRRAFESCENPSWYREKTTKFATQMPQPWLLQRSSGSCRSRQ